MFDVDLLINNADVEAAGGATFDRLNPLTGEVASRAAAAGTEDAGVPPMQRPQPSRPGRGRGAGCPPRAAQQGRRSA